MNHNTKQVMQALTEEITQDLQTQAKWLSIMDTDQRRRYLAGTTTPDEVLVSHMMKNLPNNVVFLI